MKKSTINTQTQRYKSPDGTIRYVKDSKLHNWDGPALIPEGNFKKAEYHIFGIPYTREQFDEIKKHNNGLPWFKQVSVKSGGGRV